MNQNTNTLPRRSFLTGIASVVGATALSPTALAAAKHSTSSEGLDTGHQLHFWDGNAFVSTNANSPSKPVSGAVRIRIERIGHFGTYSSIDVLLPGGVFHALSGHESGAPKAVFTTQLLASKPLGFVVRSGEVTTSFDLPVSQLKHGTYLLTADTQPLEDLYLRRDQEFPVTSTQGMPTHVPYTLIDISEA